MKKRKVKLFASIASLAMVVAVMGVGVWAATSQNISVNSTVSFQTTAIEATVALAISGAAVDTEATTTPEAITITTATTNEPTQNMNVNVVLADSHEDGMFSYDDGTIIYTFTITNTSTAVDLNYQVTTEAAPQGSHWTAAITGAVDGVLEGSIAKDATPSKAATVTVIFTYGDAENKYPVQSFTGDVAKLPTVKFVLQSADFE